MTRLERDVGIAVGSVAVFIKFWLATMPALPEPAAHAARAKAGECYDAFVTALGRRLAREITLRQELSEDIGMQLMQADVSMVDRAPRSEAGPHNPKIE